jgi:hypothetical protein
MSDLLIALVFIALLVAPAAFVARSGIRTTKQ